MEQKKLFSDILNTVTKYFIVLVVVVVLGIACSGIRVVESGNVGLILRFGQLVGDTREEQIHEPGLLLAFPYIIDEVIMVPTSSVIEQSVTTYYTPDNGTTSDGAYVITGDQNVATLSASVKYVISDPVAYALNVSDISGIINACVSNAMLMEAAGFDVDDLLTTGKDAFATAAMDKAARKLEAAGVGVTLSTLELTLVSMPIEVREIYNDVNSATVQAATMLENARNYKAKQIPYAEGVATGLVTQANANHSTSIAQANAALYEFWGVLEEYESNPQVVRTRLYGVKASQFLEKVGSIRVVQDGETKIILGS